MFDGVNFSGLNEWDLLPPNASESELKDNKNRCESEELSAGHNDPLRLKSEVVNNGKNNQSLREKAEDKTEVLVEFTELEDSSGAPLVISIAAVEPGHSARNKNSKGPESRNVLKHGAVSRPVHNIRFNT